jgi:hypothetical protein
VPRYKTGEPLRYGESVTLILGMSKPEGIYLSADYRVTELPSRNLVDDASLKHLTVHYPPEGGPKVLLAYTGLAFLPDGTPTGQWLRETLRGESEYIDQSMAHLRERLDRDVARAKAPLIINALVLENDRRLFGGLSNLRRDPGSKDATVMRSFGYVMNELDGPFVFGNGSGVAALIADHHFELLRDQLDVWPRKPLDHMRLLAAVNRRVAAKESTVSPYCHVSYINADERTSAASQAFVELGEEVPFEMPFLLFGIDLTAMMRNFHDASEAFIRGETSDFQPRPPSDEELQRRS